MMVHSISRSSHLHYPEVAIADLTHFQIAVLTTVQRVNKQVFSTQISVPTRRYQTQGWLIFKGQLLASIDQLVLGDINSNHSPFAPIRRLAPGIPISFEVTNSHPLPNLVSAQALFSCTLSNTTFPYLSVFHQLRPRFVAIYPFTQGDSLVAKANQMELDAIDFIQQNVQQLKRVPFYQIIS